MFLFQGSNAAFLTYVKCRLFLRFLSRSGCTRALISAVAQRLFSSFNGVEEAEFRWDQSLTRQLVIFATECRFALSR